MTNYNTGSCCLWLILLLSVPLSRAAEHDFFDQDHDKADTGLKLIKLDANGKILDNTATNAACIKDVATGLMWELKTDDGGLRDKDWNYTWFQSDPALNNGNSGTENGGTCYTQGRCDTEKFVQDVNASGLCGFHDWRLPNSDELLSIVDSSQYKPLINADYFPNTVAKSFWSSSLDSNFANYSLTVCFSTGYVFYGYRDDNYPVRLVRGKAISK